MAEVEQSTSTLDPRIRRTRQMLRNALFELSQQKPYDQISVQDIAERSTVNRATFYDHYADKAALMEDVIGSRFEQFVEKQSVQFQTGCRAALTRVVLATIDFVAEVTGGCTEFWRQFEPFVQSALQKRLQAILLAGMKHHGAGAQDKRLQVAMASWAIYGAAQYWLRLEPRPDAEGFAGCAVELLEQIL